ncbi:DUF4282 domain-containing protein [Thiomicrospira sp. R3]|uniref:DUF4282 domain-containing protein n=1 Tax=Thiomicrospira sp. R3 TaxID=3035472 RepID=UPI00259B148B|nr:DUF4282 domain-containing protein [Thiomicrospira sp. R3]WFE67753.1 DUF4282 domain-containing protein [Thiomicrospira sp. R3]
MFKSILFFDSMLTPKIITAVYWLLLGLVVISGLGAMFAQNFLVGLLIILFGAIGVRIWCELLIVLFKINDNLKKMTDKTQD